MIGKRKAQELINKFEVLKNEQTCHELESSFIDRNVAKQCALIAINELIKEHEQDTHDDDRWEYWIKVKQEIEKL
jgi:hypothetical protein